MVIGGRVKYVTIGLNSERKNVRTCKSTHAEIDAINKIFRWKNRPEKLDMIVVRLNHQGQLGESRPCYNCIKQIMKANIGIRNIYYSTADMTVQMERLDLMLNSPLTKTSTGYRRHEW